MNSLPNDMTRLILTFLEQDTLFDLVLVSKKLRQIVFSANVTIKANDSTVGGKTLARFKNARIELSNPGPLHSWDFRDLNAAVLVTLYSVGNCFDVIDLLKFHNLKTITCSGFKSPELLYKLTGLKSVSLYLYDEIETKHFPEFGSKLDYFSVSLGSLTTTEKTLADCCAVTHLTLNEGSEIPCNNLKLLTRLESLQLDEYDCAKEEDSYITRQSEMNFHNIAGLSKTLTNLQLEVYEFDCQVLLLMTNLQSLVLSRTRCLSFENVGSKLSSLTSLEVYRCNIFEKEIEKMTSLRKLRATIWYSMNEEIPCTTKLVNLTDKRIEYRP